MRVANVACGAAVQRGRPTRIVRNGAFTYTGVSDDKWQNPRSSRRLVIEWTTQL
jgi:hypothetical protein